VRNDRTVPEAQDAPRPAREIRVVGHEHEGRGQLTVQLDHQVDHRGAGRGVEIPRGLVGEKDRGPVAECPSQGDSLLLAARQLGGIVVAAAGKPHALEQSLGARPRFFAPQLEGDLDVLASRQGRDQMKGLEDETDLLAAEEGAFVFVQSREVSAIEDDPARRGLVEASQEPEEGRLSASGGTHDGQETAGLQFERDIFEDGEVAAPGTIGLRERLAGQHGLQWRLPTPNGMIAKNRHVLFLTAVALASCSTPRSSAPQAAPSGIAPSAPSAAVDVRPTVVFLGTSLTAGLGLDIDDAYPALIQRKIDAAGLKYRVVNAGVSGETSAGALRRIDWILREPVAVLVVETGANDGLRGQDPAVSRANIQSILDRARRQSPPPRVVLAGMKALPNYGADYVKRFDDLFPELARANHAPLVPFLLEGVAGVPTLNQADGIHPTAAGHALIAETVWRTLRPLLAEHAP
jgi:acyl-CoA thioesterase I